MSDGLQWTRPRLGLGIQSMEFLLSLSVSYDGIIRCVRSKVMEDLRARGVGGQVRRRTPDLYGLGVLYDDSSMLQLQRICSMIAQDVSKKIALATGFDWVVVVFRILWQQLLKIKIITELLACMN